MLFLYNLLQTLTMPIWFPLAWIKARKRKEQPNWQERMGDFKLSPSADKRRIWLHAVSVGEVVAAKPILREIRKALPKHEIVLTVTTSSGHQTARDSEAGLFDHLAYFPFDMARFQLAAMQQVQPEVLAIMETEIWMNCLWAAKTFDVQTLLVNGRISDRSYPRALKLRGFYRTALSFLDRALMQSKVDLERIEALGAREAVVLGNCKFDGAREALTADPAVWASELGLDPGKPVIVIGSTRGEDEEGIVIDAIRQIGLNRVQVIHAPRHVERAEELAQAVRAQFGDVARRSQDQTGPYLILDTYGELAQVYSVADVVVVGGGFANLGGQNIIQPLALGKPVIHGPHMQNFRDIATLAERSGASLVVEPNGPDLAAAIESLLADPNRREEMGKAAKKLVDDNTGASRRYAEAIRAAAHKSHEIRDARKARLAKKSRA